jgi:hypothetical protein
MRGLFVIRLFAIARSLRPVVGSYRPELRRGTIMILRLIVFCGACACLAGRADAMPVLGLQLSSPLQTVQSRDVWHSPQNSLDNFPLLGPEDCARYGRKNGYSECQGGRPEKSTSAVEQTPEPLAPQKAELVPPQVPLPVRRARVLDEKAAPLARSPSTPPKEPSPARVSADDQLAKTVGALLVVGFEGRSAAEDGPQRVATALRQGRVGGVLLRRANIESPTQLKALTAFLSRGQDRPPLIVIEHSGRPDDALARAAGFQPVASPREVGARGDALAAFIIYQQMAEKLATAGVTLNVGPSATACPSDASPATMDCFGSDPRHSAAFATAFNLAHQSRGVLTAMRYQVAAAGDGAAFSEMAKRKAPDVLIVGAHAANSPPARKTVNALRPAGYSGAILLDSIEQQDAAEKLVSALSRGADMVLFRTASGLEAGFSDKALGAIRSAIDAGRLAPARLDAAASRAASLRQQLQASPSRTVSRGESATQPSPAR